MLEGDFYGIVFDGYGELCCVFVLNVGYLLVFGLFDVECGVVVVGVFGLVLF